MEIIIVRFVSILFLIFFFAIGSLCTSCIKNASPLSEEEKRDFEINAPPLDFDLAPPSSDTASKPAAVPPLSKTEVHTVSKVEPAPSRPEAVPPLSKTEVHTVSKVEPVPSNILLCGDPERACTQEELDYIEEIKQAFQEVKNLNKFKVTTPILTSQAKLNNNPLNLAAVREAKVIFFSEMHDSKIIVQTNFSLIRRLLHQYKQKNESAVVLVESVDANVGETDRVWRSLGRWAYSLKRITPGEFYGKNSRNIADTGRSLYLETKKHLLFLKDEFPCEGYYGWDVSGETLRKLLAEKSFHLYENVLFRNESLVKAIKKFVDQGLDHILVVLGFAHMPDGDLRYFHKDKFSPLVKNLGYEKAYLEAFSYDSPYHIEKSAAQPIYDYMKNIHGVYLEHVELTKAFPR